ncbi:GDP-mannose 4,6-dehydratase [Candidatus Sumerlaeota bacterium]|nr:GDP-mannose 4,6-dehydratase [Candidatus Sumerlaeota bacterium]
MRVLITGGAGFIGSHLAECLLGKNHRVAVIDDLSTGSISNIRHLKENERFEYVIDSIMNVPRLAEMVDEADCVYHLAAAVGVQRIVDDPVGAITTNIRGTEIVLDLADKKKKKVLITSTSEVYGKSTQIPFREDGDLVLGATVRPRWSYACSKAIDEFLALAYGAAHDLPIAIARLFNTVGPRQTGRYGMVIPRFVGQGLRGEPITVYGDGNQTRCFTHVADVVGALVGLMETRDADGGVFNVGSQDEISINNLASRVRKATGDRSDIVHIPFAEAYDENFEDMDRRVPDISKAQDLIGYRPTYTIDQIIQGVVEFMRGEKDS